MAIYEVGAFYYGNTDVSKDFIHNAKKAVMN